MSAGRSRGEVFLPPPLDRGRDSELLTIFSDGPSRDVHALALQLIDQLVEAIGPVGEVLDTRGLIHLTAGQANEAAKDFLAAIRQDPAAVKYFHLAQAQLAAGERLAARASLLRAQKKGLKEEVVPPLERSAFRALASELEGK